MITRGGRCSSAGWWGCSHQTTGLIKVQLWKEVTREGILFSGKSERQDFILGHIHISTALLPSHPHCLSAALITFAPRYICIASSSTTGDRGDRLLGVPRDKTKGNGHKLKHMKILFLLWGQSNTGAGSPERLYPLLELFKPHLDMVLGDQL